MYRTGQFCLTTALLAGSLGAANAETVVFEDFEDATVTYIASPAEDLSTIVDKDYFGRIAPDIVSSENLPNNISFTNSLGSGYYGAQDTDGPNNDNVGVESVELRFYGLTITNLTDLEFSFYLAEDDDGSDNDWDTTSSLIVEYRIDSNDDQDFQKLFAVEAELVGESNQTNNTPRVDTDFDGIGDGAEITDTFTQFSVDIAGIGDTLDFRITITDLNAANEDIAIDNVLVQGAVPEPGSMTLLAISAAMLIHRRR